jgi:hypothetical protein
VLALGVLLVAAGCDGEGGRKVVLREDVCGNVRILRLKLGERNEVVLDNTRHSDQQDGMTVRMEQFPVLIHGEVPPNSVIGPRFTTVVLQAQPGEEKTVEVEPTFTGTYTAVCAVRLRDESGIKTIAYDTTFELIE